MPRLQVRAPTFLVGMAGLVFGAPLAEQRLGWSHRVARAVVFGAGCRLMLAWFYDPRRPAIKC
jgi:hypothetical protein